MSAELWCLYSVMVCTFIHPVILIRALFRKKDVSRYLSAIFYIAIEWIVHVSENLNRIRVNIY